MADENDLQAAFLSAAKLLGRGNYEITAEFRPYAGLKSQIRKDGPLIRAKVSDGYEAASMNELTGLAVDLLAKLFNVRVVGGSAALFLEEFRKLNGKGVFDLHDELRKKRGRRRNGISEGGAYALGDLLSKVLRENPEIFSSVKKPTIVWSRGASRRRLAFYDSAFHEIVVSKKFDSRAVPQFFLEYLIFHELLHAKHDAEYGVQRRVHHKGFKWDERKFPQYGDAMRFMKGL